MVRSRKSKFCTATSCWRTDAANSKSELVTLPEVFVQDIKSLIMSCGRGVRHTMFFTAVETDARTGSCDDRVLAIGIAVSLCVDAWCAGGGAGLHAPVTQVMADATGAILHAVLTVPRFCTTAVLAVVVSSWDPKNRTPPRPRPEASTVPTTVGVWGTNSYNRVGRDARSVASHRKSSRASCAPWCNLMRLRSSGCPKASCN